ncbi:MAG: hypothetical protein SFY66_19655 [Oculatellaceae cyanobacterium bins.114]|nr:hypothetical protein [Oculatellaceae cyanobacterium bins.114]
MKPRDFCRNWFNVTEEGEQAWGYRKKCVNLLAEVIGVKVDTVERWGSGIDFPDMPPQYENTLGYALTIKRIVEVASSGSEDIMRAVIEQLRSQGNL